MQWILGTMLLFILAACSGGKLSGSYAGETDDGQIYMTVDGTSVDIQIETSLTSGTFNGTLDEKEKTIEGQASWFIFSSKAKFKYQVKGGDQVELTQVERGNGLPDLTYKLKKLKDSDNADKSGAAANTSSAKSTKATSTTAQPTTTTTTTEAETASYQEEFDKLVANGELIIKGYETKSEMKFNTDHIELGQNGRGFDQSNLRNGQKINFKLTDQYISQLIQEGKKVRKERTATYTVNGLKTVDVTGFEKAFDLIKAEMDAVNDGKDNRNNVTVTVEPLKGKFYSIYNVGDDYSEITNMTFVMYAKRTTVDEVKKTNTDFVKFETGISSQYSRQTLQEKNDAGDFSKVSYSFASDIKSESDLRKLTTEGNYFKVKE